jgi:signal transduction histidine kinase
VSNKLSSNDLLRVFAAELPERALWFVRLRWVAGAALLVFAGVVPTLGMPVEWRRAWIVAVLVFAYNTVLHWLTRRLTRAREVGYQQLARCILLQTITDLAALLFLIHLTGGATSPFVPFVVFHMVIGTIILSARTMAVVGAGVWVVAAGLFLGTYGTAGHPFIPVEMRFGILAVLAWLLAGTIYLTDTVATRFRSRGAQLFQLNEQMRAKQTELEALLAEMRSAERRKSHFMLLSAHQLRSPLATVKTGLEALHDGYVDPSSPRSARLISGAIERVDGLLATVNELLELAKLREGAKQAPWVPDVNLAQLVVDVADALTPIAEARGIALESGYDTGVVLDRGVPPDLVYAIENIVHNALKYSYPGGTVHVQVRRDATFGVIEVRDHGIGVPAEFLPDLFVEFIRAPNAKRHASEGTGLGLAIVREVVEAHGGRVEVESQVGEGSAFRLVLPIHGGARART